MPDKAIDLLTELLPHVAQAGRDVLLRSDVDEIIEGKTGVPHGEIAAPERERLLSLEKILHDRVVGQDEAVNAVAAAMRRARAGVSSPDRPMGTFLFLGPTGVGKTETAKALAEALFGSEDDMMRLDMSEFSTPDALDRLIGDADTGTPGRLSNLLRERQHGVLLLDEFEKSTGDVHNLFLQILDEGRATDAFGREINARSTVIIATSNAGANLIMEQLADKRLTEAEHQALIDEIISRGIFRPELINRFDGTIIFHPLQKDHVREIAKRKISEFVKRLQEEKGIQIDVTDGLISRVVREGYDPEFGGRPLNRAIESLVEQVIADRIIAGDVRPGATVKL
jgi:ATP-dependent Clp protease ATP-binding subunit ClpA